MMSGKRVMAVRLLVAGLALSLSAANAQAATAAKDAHDWLTGRWCFSTSGEHIEEEWSSARGGLRLAFSRTFKGDKATGFEFMRIQTREGKVYFVAQPNGNPPVSFEQTAAGSDWVRFENRDHDFPQMIEYRRVKNALIAEISGPGEKGETAKISFKYTACSSNATGK